MGENGFRNTGRAGRKDLSSAGLERMATDVGRFVGGIPLGRSSFSLQRGRRGGRSKASERFEEIGESLR